MKRSRKLPFTCKDCPDRYPGCHDHCKKYKREKEIWDKQKIEDAKEKEIADYICHINAERYDTHVKNKKTNRGRKYFFN